MTSFSVDEIVRILNVGSFDTLVGIVEDAYLEAKGSPYQLSASEVPKQELAKDVAALANANGGIILLGFRTAKDASTTIERIEACRPFDLGLIDLDQYRKVLQDWIYPPIHSIEIACYADPHSGGKGVAAIVVPPSAAEGKPYVVTRSVEPDGKVRGTLIGYYERVQATIPAASAETIRGQLRDGLRFAELSQRLGTIEAFLGSLASQHSETGSVVPMPAMLDGVTEQELQSRIVQAEQAVERSSQPNIVLAVASTTQSLFLELFQSQSVNLVKLLEQPPVLRPDGFAISLKDGFRPAEIVQGTLRRVMARGFKSLELWRDGVLIGVGPGDDDLLCWYTRSQTPERKPGLPIRNFVLGEVTLNFINLAFEVFKKAEPTPEGLKFLLVLDNMTEEGVACTISSDRDNRPFRVGFGQRKSAPSARIVSAFTGLLANIDVGIVAYHLLADLYSQFGFNNDEMPYVQRDPDANRVTQKSLFGEPWK